jgi:hypothetical protein
MSAPTNDDGGQLVKLDFTAHREPVALANDIQTRVNELDRDLATAIASEEQWRRWRETAYRRVLKHLRGQLAEERAINAPHESDVLDALAGFDSPASATEIAEQIYRRQPPHSAVVRIGMTLSKLTEGGRVERVLVKAHGEKRNRWLLGARDTVQRATRRQAV